LNGVYTFLEEQLGVRWFTPEFESVPKTNIVAIPTLDQLHIPRLEYREVFWTIMMRNADFAARHRLNGQHYGLQEKHGGRFAVYFPFVHSFDSLIPPNLYKEHPEYFPFIDGQRATGYVQRCLSNPEVLKLSIARVREWIRTTRTRPLSVCHRMTPVIGANVTNKALDDAEGSSPSAHAAFR
jgi:hypothetical protein